MQSRQAILAGFIVSSALGCAPSVRTGSPTTAARPVTTIDLVTVRRGEYGRYLRFIEANWVENRRIAREQGIVTDFRVLAVPDSTRSDWHVALLTEYRDSTRYANREALFAPILAARRRVLIDGRDSDAMVLSRTVSTSFIRIP